MRKKLLLPLMLIVVSLTSQPVKAVDIGYCTASWRPDRQSCESCCYYQTHQCTNWSDSDNPKPIPGCRMEDPNGYTDCMWYCAFAFFPDPCSGGAC